MATDGHIESVHPVADGKIYASLGNGTFSFLNEHLMLLIVCFLLYSK